MPAHLAPRQRIQIFRPSARVTRGTESPGGARREIVVLDPDGRPRFYDLLRRRGDPVFYAFDCLSLEGRDLRMRPLIERKRILARLVRDQPGILYAQHFDGDQGSALFSLACEQDLEGIVAKRKDAAYGDGWFKIRNPGYSQYEGRRELFEKRRRAPLMGSAV